VSQVGTLNGKPLYQSSTTHTVSYDGDTYPNSQLECHWNTGSNNWRINRAADRNNPIYSTSNFSATLPTTGWNNFNGCSGTLTINSVLPVELTSFTINTDGAKNNLTWSTASERGASHFDIERSRDGKTFEKVGEVKAKGETANYAFTDSKAVSGTSYYRLKMVDFDGTTDYSKIVSVQSYGKGKVKIYPTVTADNLVVEGAKSVTIVNMMGQVVLQREMNSSVVSLQELPKGIYIVKGEATEGGTFLEKIVKE
jgi:hypothetical protein